jgi:hypothetical protein
MPLSVPIFPCLFFLPGEVPCLMHLRVPHALSFFTHREYLLTACDGKLKMTHKKWSPLLTVRMLHEIIKRELVPALQHIWQQGDSLQAHTLLECFPAVSCAWSSVPSKILGRWLSWLPHTCMNPCNIRRQLWSRSAHPLISWCTLLPALSFGMCKGNLSRALASLTMVSLPSYSRQMTRKSYWLN